MLLYEIVCVSPISNFEPLDRSSKFGMKFVASVSTSAPSLLSFLQFIIT